jgi:2-polyprenyl-6-hydroxyphenyl methylase/3-demethylubiquinone-9 3-methyltransferase
LPSFRSINLALSAGIHWRLPKRFTFPFTVAYEQTVLGLGNLLDSGTMLDIGAGVTTAANKRVGLNENLTIIGLDILEKALHDNSDLDHRVVADACKQWPLADASVDLVVSRSVIEHLADTRTFADECRRVLKPGGYGVHLLPGRNAPFALLNRLLPAAVSRRLIDWAFPHNKDLLGFHAYYRGCTFAELKNLFENSGLSVDEIHCRYYQSTYYGAFFPVYLLSVIYDLIVWKLGIKRLSSQLLLVVSRGPT